MANLYAVLGVQPGCSETDIKNAYRSKARIYHPDKGGTGEIFKQINAAYEVLIDTERRAHYDRFGTTDHEPAPQQAAAAAAWTTTATPHSSFFSMFFGQQQQHQQQSPDTVQELTLTLEQLFVGKTFTAEVHATVPCSACTRKACPGCAGRGVQTSYRQMLGMLQRVETICPMCKGAATIASTDACSLCNNTGTKTAQQTVHVRVPPAACDGDRFSYIGIGDRAPGQQEAANVVFVVRTQPHAVFTRTGLDLSMKKKVTLAEALCGLTFVVQHLNGQEIKVCTQKLLQPNSSHRVKGSGMCKEGNNNVNGDLIIHFDICYPNTHAECILLQKRLAEEFI